MKCLARGSGHGDDVSVYINTPATLLPLVQDDCKPEAAAPHLPMVIIGRHTTASQLMQQHDMATNVQSCLTPGFVLLEAERSVSVGMHS
jgi:hypothetical protein